MSTRADELQRTADEQIAELISLVSTLDDATLRRACAGRAKLGDGTIAASASHTADNYQRIAEFVQTSAQMAGRDEPTRHSGHRIPRFLRTLGHRPQANGKHGPNGDHYDDRYTAQGSDPTTIVRQLSAARESLQRIRDLSDGQLDAVPPSSSFRFCDGQRTLAQILASLLKHQRHQLDALEASIG
jgi:hypothetical protein